MKRALDVLSGDKSSIISNFVTLSKVWKISTTEGIALVTTAIRIDSKGELLVLVHDNIWLTELNYLKVELLERLNANGMKVKSLNFKYSPAYVKNSKQKQRLRVITEDEKIYIENISQNINNKELKESFKNAMYAYFQRYTLTSFIGG